MGKKRRDSFDFENAFLDARDAGGDPDYVNSRDPKKRDDYLRKLGLDPGDYDGSKGRRPSGGSLWGNRTGKK